MLLHHTVERGKQKLVCFMQVIDVAVCITGQQLLLILPHSQDIGRFYAFTGLWQKPAVQLLQVQARSTARALTAVAASLSRCPGLQLEHAVTGRPAASSQIGTAHDVQPRIQLSMSMAEASLRMESHPLERRLAILRPVRMKTAAAMSTLDSAMNEYERMAKTSAARAAAKKPSIAASMLSQEILDSTEVLERLAGHMVSQDRYEWHTSGILH